jgi:hypothetical protein
LVLLVDDDAAAAQQIAVGGGGAFPLLPRQRRLGAAHGMRQQLGLVAHAGGHRCAYNRV